MINIENTPTIGHSSDSFSSSRRMGSSLMLIDEDMNIIGGSSHNKRSYMDDEDMACTNPIIDNSSHVYIVNDQKFNN